MVRRGEFAATAAAFVGPDRVEVTLNACRTRFLPDEPGDAGYDHPGRRLAATEHLAVPTLTIQGGSDYCDAPEASAGLERWFTGPYRRVVLDGVGHFPLREAPRVVADLVDDHLGRHR